MKLVSLFEEINPRRIPNTKTKTIKPNSPNTLNVLLHKILKKGKINQQPLPASLKVFRVREAKTQAFQSRFQLKARLLQQVPKPYFKTKARVLIQHLLFPPSARQTKKVEKSNRNQRNSTALPRIPLSRFSHLGSSRQRESQ